MYQTNYKLAEYLKRKGFKEITFIDEMMRGKRRFRKGYNRVIIFDGEFAKLIEKGIVLYEGDFLDKKILREFIKTGVVKC